VKGLAAVLLATIAIAVAAGPAPAAERDQAELVRVNGDLLTDRDLTRYLTLFDLQLDTSAPEGLSPLEQEELDAQKRTVGLQTLVERRLLAQAARAEYLGDAQMEEALKKLGDEAFQDFVREHGSIVRASGALAEFGCTADDYRAFQADAILIGQYLREHVYENLRVSPAEVRAYYEQNEPQFVLPRQVIFRQILFVATDAAGRETATRAAEDALAKIDGGADLAKLADELSADRDTWQGGLHRVLIPDEAGDWVPPVVAGLEPGQLSGVRTVAGGLAVARLEKVVPPGPLTFAQVEGTIKDGLLRRKRAAALAECVRRLRAEGTIEYLPGARRYGFEPTAKPAGDDKPTGG
jgi:parvulin-like peptidyl-prolyl isomerase